MGGLIFANVGKVPRLVARRVYVAQRLSPTVTRADHTGGDGPYGYTPTEWICALFVALFGLSTSTCKERVLV